ncbi:MAG: phosphoadenosine phosphosulfate reductase family protein [Rubrivivax sp.]
MCCSIRKVRPMKTAMTGLDAWITAIRRDQSHTRPVVPRSSAGTSSSACGRSARSCTGAKSRCMQYVGEHNVPINPMLYEGYSSIGCKHCTAKPDPNGDGRSGRWLGFLKTECGLHAVPVAESTPVELTVKNGEMPADR